MVKEIDINSVVLTPALKQEHLNRQIDLFCLGLRTELKKRGIAAVEGLSEIHYTSKKQHDLMFGMNNQLFNIVVRTFIGDRHVEMENRHPISPIAQKWVVQGIETDIDHNWKNK